jgi:uncharacterized delta-60 repeat protein
MSGCNWTARSLPYYYNNCCEEGGSVGSTGPTGYTGIQGPTGIQGQAGIQGPTGYTGIQGPTGPPGSGGSGGGATPGGPINSLQYNLNNTGLTGSANLTYTNNNTTLTLAGTMAPNVIKFNTTKIVIAGNSTVTNQGSYAIAVGSGAGQTGQGSGAVAIGLNAGQLGQGSGAIAIGNNTGVGFIQIAGAYDYTFLANNIPNQYTSSFDSAMFAVAIDANSNIVCGGLCSRVYLHFPPYVFLCNGICRLTSTGLPDYTFNIGTGFTENDNVTVGRVNSLLGDSIGNILVGGTFTKYNGTSCSGFVRLTSSGLLDSTFNNTTGYNANVFVFDTTGNILVGYSNFARLTSNGTLDTTFNNGGAGTNSYVYAIAIDASGNIIIGGSFIRYNGTTRNRIARLTSSGALDSTFNVGTGFNNTVYAIAIDASGNIIVGGGFTSYNGSTRNRIVRLTSTGAVDATFNIGTGFSSNDVNVILIDPYGYIIVNGTFGSYNGNSNIITPMKLSSTGTLDTTFNSNILLYGNGSGPATTIDVLGNIVTTLQQMGLTRIYGTSVNYTQEPYAIAIGAGAGQHNQHANSIILNASGLELDSGTTGAFYVKPIRQPTSIASYSSLFYDTVGGEIVSGQGSKWVGGNTGPYAAPTTGITTINTTSTKLYEKTFKVTNSINQYVIHYNVAFGSGGSNNPITSTIGLSSIVNDVSGNCINLYNNSTGIVLTGANTDLYIAAVVNPTIANLSGFATVSNLSTGTYYVSLWAASQTAQTFSGQKINLVIY